MSEFDWLDEELEDNLPALVPRGVSPIEIPTERVARDEAVQKAWDLLTPKQQHFIDTLRKHGCNVRATCRALAGTPWSVALRTVQDWKAKEDFAFIFKVVLAIARDTVIDRDRLLVRADDIAEQALELKPILYKGEPTGFYENHLDVALRANEQLMKTQKMLGNDQEGPVQQQGPALIIQVIAPQSGNVIDVTPGIVVALPEPEPAANEP